ncbi:UNVERIFIED_ORG: hypothetical protein DFO82_1970 [Idiomarina abyssalis]|uniref:hypothetical protein n=1 Tax=Idiomarina sp. 017G TaxID=2183988 RepID=UPI000E0F511B|nr:hypothetical protein [Idiomarina sp. 017G]TDO48198.1 hypothetical protein DEU30_107133 [Idiomarina sp. 017G]
MGNAQAEGMPQEIVRFENAFKSVPGVSEVEIGKHHFSQDDVSKLDEVYFGGQYADLPIAMLRRTNGNLDNELLIFAEFTVAPNKQGLNALEFLSWWVRDLSRSGDNVQIRSIGLPPMAGETIQLGSTLRFWFEAYIVTDREDIGLVLAKINEFSKSLEESIRLYEPAFQENM